VVDVYEAVADPTRRQLLELLRDGDRPVNELAGAFGVTRSRISQQLRVLRDCGLVQEQRVGRHRLYELRAQGLREMFLWIRSYEAFWDERLSRLRAHLDATSGSESPHGRHSS
jgi:DNA-binding transcriptional ArsR family regulator